MKQSSVDDYVLNCVRSEKTENDWTLEDAAQANAISLETKIPETVDLRQEWWNVRDQNTTGACVGFATADGVLRYLYFKAGLIQKNDLPSPRFIWMANKETDDITSYPTTFIEAAGTQTKLALRVAKNYGCVLEPDLPMDGGLADLSVAAFYTKAARLRIVSYHNLRNNQGAWRRWIALQGPILVRLNVDRTWDSANQTNGHLESYQPNTFRGGHAVCLVGYTKEYFIVRNSWGEPWGDNGFAYAHNGYARDAFDEAYGAIL